MDMMLKALGFDPKEFEEKIASAFAFLEAMQKDIAEIKEIQDKTEQKLKRIIIMLSIQKQVDDNEILENEYNKDIINQTGEFIPYYKNIVES